MGKLSSLVKGNLNSTTLKRRLRKLYSLFLVLFMFVSSSDYSVYQDFFNSAKALDYSNVSITSITLNGEPTIQAGGTVQYTIELSETIFEVFHTVINYNIISEGLTNSLLMNFSVSNNGTTLILNSQVPLYNSNGNWSISSIQFQGASSNLDFAFTSNPITPSDFDLITGNFSVIGAVIDTQPPQLTGITVSPSIVTVGQKAIFNLGFLDEVSGVNCITFELVDDQGRKSLHWFCPQPGSISHIFEVDIFESTPGGVYTVSQVRLTDKAGNTSFYVSESLGYLNEIVYDFSYASFTVEGTYPIPEAPDSVIISVDKSILVGADSTVIRVTVDKTHQEYSHIDAYYIDQYGSSVSHRLNYVGNGMFESAINSQLYGRNSDFQLTHIWVYVDGYSFIIYNEAYYPLLTPSMDLSGGNYSLTGTLPFPTAPDYVNVSVDKPVLIGDDSTVLRLVVDKTYQVYHQALAYYSNQYGETLTYHMTYIGEGQFEGFISSSRNGHDADYQLIYIQFLIGIDDDGYGSDLFTIFNEAYDPLSTPSMDLNGGNYSVTGTMYDVQPAQLTGIFVSPSIATIGQRVIYNLDFMDDVSGVHYVEMHVTDEQGRGYWFTKYDQSNISFEFDVSKYTVGGAYTVRYVRVDDNAGNQVFYVSQSLGHSNEILYDFSGASFTVEGTLPQPTAPDTVSVSVDKSVLVGADSTAIRVTVDKAYQDYSYAYADYINQFGESRFHFLTYIGNGVFEDTISSTLFEREATYQLTHIQIIVDGYSFTFFNEAYDPLSTPSMDFSSGNFSVTETQYGNAPRFDYLNGAFSIDSLTIDETIKYTLYLDNPNYEFEVIYATFYNEHYREIFMQLYPIGDGAYEGEFIAQKYTTPGLYQLRNLQATINDYWVYTEHMEGGTEFPYFDFSEDAFEVYGTVFDIEPPFIEASTVSKQLVEKGDRVVYDFYLADTDSFATGGYITLINEGNVSNEIEMLTFHLEYVEKEHFRIPLYIHSYVKNGKWSIYRIYLWDAAGNSIEYYNLEYYTSYNPIDLSHLDFIVQNNVEDNTPPILHSIEMITTSVDPEGLVKVQMDIQDDYSDIQKVHLSFLGKSTKQWFSIEGRMLSSGINVVSGHAWSGYVSDEYELIYINMSDWAGNWVTICNTENKYAGMYCYDDLVSQSLPNVKFQLNESNPVERATFIEEFTFTPSIVEAGQEVQATIKLAAEYWGARTIFISIPEVDYPNTYPYFEMFNMGNGVYSGKIRIDNKLRWQSEYRVSSIDIHYENHIISVVNQSDADPSYHRLIADFSDLKFSVIQTNKDETSPEVGSISIGKNSYNQNENLVFNMQINETGSYVENIQYRFRVDGEIVEYPFEFWFSSPVISKSGTAVLEHRLTRQLKPGFVEIDYIRVFNSHGLTTTLYNEKFYSESEGIINFDHLAFTLLGDDYDVDEPVFESIFIDKNTLGPNDVLNIEISAYDLGSGVRSAFVQFKNSSDTSSLGRYLYTRLTPNLEGKLTGSLTIDPFTQPGNYVIELIVVSDFAGNYAWLNPLYSDSDNDWNRFYYLEQSFSVVGTQLDNILPTLNDFALNRQEALIGETIEATVDAFDEPSGLEYISIVYRNGNYGFSLNGYPPSNPTDPYTVSGTIGNFLPPGVYEVSYVHMQDHAGNVRTIYNSSINNPELNIQNFRDKAITIYGQTEQITIESVRISQQQLHPGSLVNLVMDINDDIIKPDQVTVYYTSDLGQQKEVVMALSEITDYYGQLLIGEFEPSDTWTMDRIVFIDRFGSEFILYNQAIYLDQSAVFDASAGNFTVDNPNVGDLDAPQLNGVEVTKGAEEPDLVNAFSPRSVTNYVRNVNTNTVSSTAFYPNDIVEFKVDAVDEVSGVDRLLITYVTGSTTVEFDVALVAQNDGTYIGRTRIKDYHPSGIWYVTKFVLVDKAGNKYTKQTTDPTSGLTMFDHLRLTVEGTTHDQVAPVLSNIQVTDKTLGKGDVLEIIAEASDDFSGISKFEIVVSAKTIGVERKITMYKIDSGQFVGHMNITDNIVADFWIIKSVELLDVAGNVRVIQNVKISNPNMFELRNFDEQNFVVRGLASIQLISQPTRLKYHIGDSFDSTGLRVKAIYTDGSEEEIDISKVVLHGYNNSIVNPSLNILVQYENRSTSFAINVYQRQPDHLVILSEPFKTLYYVDDVLDLEGLSLRLVYDDGVTRELGEEERLIANPSVTTEAGQKQVIVQFESVTTTIDITVLKYMMTAPMQPEIASVTDKAISVIEVSGQEYSLDGINWQSFGLFEGLNPNQEYYIYARWAENRTHLASDSSGATVVTTERSLVPTPFTPTLLYRTDRLLEVETVVGQLYSIDGTTWQQGGIFDGLQANTTYYIVTKITQTDTSYESNVSEALVVTTDLYNPLTPDVPVLKEKTRSSLEVHVVSTQEYSLDGQLWQDSGLFEGLLSYVEYSIYTRVKATENNYASGISEPLVVYTLKTMTALEIIQQPTKLVYEQGDPINLSGLIVWGYFNDGSIENVTLTYVNIINPEVSQSEPGFYTVIMKYDDFTVTFDIEVIAKVENQTPVQITKTETMMVIVTPQGKVKVIMFDNNGRKEVIGE